MAIFFYDGVFLMMRRNTERRKEQELLMKKYIKLLAVTCIFGVLLSGCGKDKKEEKEAVPLTIYEQLEITEEPLDDSYMGAIQEGINDWVRAFLAVDSSISDKKATDKGLYQSISDENQKKKLKEERDAFYKDSTIIIGEVTTELTDTKKAKYNDKEVGVVDCKTTIRGTKNEEAFEKSYTMQMVVNYDAYVMSVFEVKNITWE